MATVSAAPLDANKPEGNSGVTPFTFVIRLDQSLSSVATVDYRVGQSTRPKLSLFQQDATADDFVGGAFPTGTVTFLPGETSKIVTIDVAGDLAFESLGAPETFAVFLSNPRNGLGLDPDSAGGPNPVEGQIVNDETQTSIYAFYVFGGGGSPAVGIPSKTAPEGNSGSVNWSFVIRRFGILAPESVTYSVSGTGENPATASDFIGGFPQGVVTFAAAEAEKTVQFSIVADREFEPNETFAISLSGPTVGTIGDMSAFGTIIDDDAPVVPTVAVPDIYVMGQGELFITDSAVVRANDLNGGPFTTVSLERPPSHGSMNVFFSNGAFFYTPARDFSGFDTFTYRASDGLPDTGVGEVTIRVAPVNAGPVPTLNIAGLTPEEQIAAVYVAALGRAPDAAGFDYWLDQLTHGTAEQGPQGLHDIAASFVLSEEAKALYQPVTSGEDVGAFVTVAYDTLFNRAPDDEGLVYWAGQIGQRMALGQFYGSVLVDIMGGTQDINPQLDLRRLMQKVTVSLAYVQAQRDLGSEWTQADDRTEAVALIDAVAQTPATLLVGITHARELVAADVL